MADAPQDDVRQDDAPQDDAGQGHLLNHLRDVHALELHSLRQLARAAQVAEEDTRAVYEEHLEQTREHERRIKELVEGHGHSASAEEDKTLRGGAVGIRQLADIPLDTPAKLAMNLFALEHLEIAAYELLGEIAEATDDSDSAQLAQEILDEERQAAEKVAETFDRAAELAQDEEDGEATLLAHLSDLHALEAQSFQLLKTAVEDVCQDDELKQLYQEHLEQTEEHERLITERLEAHDTHPSAVRDLHFGSAKFGLHDLRSGPPDALPKLAMNIFCVEQLEVAAYELLGRIAKASGDNETAEVTDKILQQERETAEAVEQAFARSVELMLQNDASYESARPAEAQVETREPEEAQGERREPEEAQDGSREPEEAGTR